MKYYLADFHSEKGLINIKESDPQDCKNYIVYTKNSNDDTVFIKELYFTNILSRTLIHVTNKGSILSDSKYLTEILKVYKDVSIVELIKDDLGKDRFIEFKKIDKYFYELLYDFITICTDKYESEYIKIHNLSERCTMNLYELATFKKQRSKLNVVIWLDDNGLYKKTGHSNRIKFQADYQETNTNNFIPMIIDKKNPRIPEDLKNKVKISNKDLESLKDFIKKYYLELQMLSNDDNYDFEDFIKDYEKKR